MKQRKDEILLRDIARKIKELREEHNISQADFYIATNINIGRIEVAKFNISVSTLKSICDYFKITLGDFLKDIPISDFSEE